MNISKAKSEDEAEAAIETGPESRPPSGFGGLVSSEPLTRLGPGLIDLHTHSRVSDGALPPSALAESAVKAGLRALALTDHDTVEGLAEFKAAGEKLGLLTIGGVEISLEHSGTMHLLGLNVNDQAEIPAALSGLETFRVERNLKIQNALGRLGYYLPWDQLLKVSGGGQMGRPHFAALLLEKGYFKSRDEVFDKLLGKGRPGYVDKKRLPPRDGLAMVREAGWAPVLAHPVSLGLSPDEWPGFLVKLCDWGLLGLEVHHPSHNPEQIDFFKNLAEQFNLTATVGSDFHGDFEPSVGLDWALTASSLGEEMVESLQSKL